MSRRHAVDPDTRQVMDKRASRTRAACKRSLHTRHTLPTEWLPVPVAMAQDAPRKRPTFGRGRQRPHGEPVAVLPRAPFRGSARDASPLG